MLLTPFLLHHITHICNCDKQQLRHSINNRNKNSVSNCIVFLRQTQYILRVITHKVTQEITLLITHTKT